MMYQLNYPIDDEKLRRILVATHDVNAVADDLIILNRLKIKKKSGYL